MPFSSGRYTMENGNFFRTTRRMSVCDCEPASGNASARTMASSTAAANRAPFPGAELDRSRQPQHETLVAPARQEALVSPISPDLSEDVLSTIGLELAAIVRRDALLDLLAPGCFDLGKRGFLKRFEQDFPQSCPLVSRESASLLPELRQ
jgi:hypothetical protein